MTTKSSKSVYEIVTDKIIAQLETANPNDYTKPWFTIGAALPQNAVTKRAYRGINIFLLGSGNWATYKAWTSKGCQVNKGEKASTAVFWSPMERVNKEGKKEKSFFLRYYSVFNQSQVTGDYARELEKPVTPMPEHARNKNCEATIAAYLKKQSIEVKPSDKAYYSPSKDYVGLPLAGQFKTVDDYYSTFFHELVHSTGHVSRLDRKLANVFGSEDYAKEELVAELGAAMLCAELGLHNNPRPDHAQYLKSWLLALRNDTKLIVKAAGYAQKACDLVMDREYKAKEETEESESVAA